VTIDRREQRVLIDHLPAAPTMVAFDDGNAILKSLAFEQPTAWLATLLERHPHLWQRAWAVEQLAARPADTLAGAALAGAARGADYPLTRAQAARALGGFPAGVALPALEAAAGDTSAQVREAAVVALAGLGGERALAVAREAWRADSSDQVRAAALVALARLAGPGARESVLQGLGAPSYRDAIQNAAIALIVQHPDSQLVVALTGQLGAQPVPAMALTALTSRGDTAARAAVRRALDDERAWVREWMLAAVEDQLTAADAVALLREAEPALRRPEARTEVSRVIGRLGRAPS
jgi:HEAT repeat protein